MLLSSKFVVFPFIYEQDCSYLSLVHTAAMIAVAQLSLRRRVWWECIEFIAHPHKMGDELKKGWATNIKTFWYWSPKIRRLKRWGWSPRWEPSFNNLRNKLLSAQKFQVSFTAKILLTSLPESFFKKGLSPKSSRERLLVAWFDSCFVM